MPNNALKFGRYFYVDILVETWLKATLLGQRWPIVTPNSSRIISQLLFSPFKVLGFSFQFLLSSLLSNETKFNAIYVDDSIFFKQRIAFKSQTNLKLFCWNLWCWFSICCICLTVLIIGWKLFGRSLLCLTNRNCCGSIVIFKRIIFF